MIRLYYFRGSDNQTITWDVENRPVTISENGTPIATFIYDGDGNRIQKTEGGETVLFINRFYEKNTTSGNFTTSYYLGSRLVAQREGTELRYIHQDHLSGTSLTTSENGTVISSIKYFPYGETKSGDAPTDVKFTGQRLDSGTGLYYYGARYYDPVIGRFISADTIIPNPANPQAFNRYTYCLNNPLKYVDPSGHLSEEERLLLVPGAGKTYVPPELDETETTVHVSPVIEIKISQTSINEVPEVEENIGGVMGFIQAFNWISYYINAEKQVVTEDYITEYWRMYVFETYVPSKNKKTTTLEIQAPGGSFFISGKAEITTDSYLFGKQTADMYEISTLPPGRTFTRSYIFVSASEDLQVNEIHIKFGYYQIAVLRELGFLPNNFSPRSITFNISTGEIY